MPQREEPHRGSAYRQLSKIANTAKQNTLAKQSSQGDSSDLKDVFADSAGLGSKDKTPQRKIILF